MSRPPTLDDLLVALDLHVALRLRHLRTLYGDPTPALVSFIASLRSDEQVSPALPPRL